MKKERIRRIPVNDMDIKAVERWLNDMAAPWPFPEQYRQ